MSSSARLKRSLGLHPVPLVIERHVRQDTYSLGRVGVQFQRLLCGRPGSREAVDLLCAAMAEADVPFRKPDIRQRLRRIDLHRLVQVLYALLEAPRGILRHVELPPEIGLVHLGIDLAGAGQAARLFRR